MSSSCILSTEMVNCRYNQFRIIQQTKFSARDRTWHNLYHLSLWWYLDPLARTRSQEVGGRESWACHDSSGTWRRRGRGAILLWHLQTTLVPKSQQSQLMHGVIWRPCFPASLPLFTIIHVAAAWSSFLLLFLQRGICVVNEAPVDAPIGHYHCCRRPRQTLNRDKYRNCFQEWAHDLTPKNKQKKDRKSMLMTGRSSRILWFEQIVVWVYDVNLFFYRPSLAWFFWGQDSDGKPLENEMLLHTLSNLLLLSSHHTIFAICHLSQDLFNSRLICFRKFPVFQVTF